MEMKHYDMSLFMEHARMYAYSASSGAHNICEDQDHLLRFWEYNKSQYLYDLLGKELILSKDMTYEMSKEEIRLDMENVIHKFFDFTQDISNKVSSLGECQWGDWDSNTRMPIRNEAAIFYDAVLRRGLYDIDTLLDGRIYEDLAVPNKQYSITLNGHTITATPGQKLMKVLGKICAALNMSERFEEYRIAHSQVLNRKKLNGSLCLSIHPLDYATASDNANGWSSCMSWKENGCYRMGTVEMMNSPYVICAYVTGKNEMSVGDDASWNSKKWRAWVIVDKDIVLINRQYPFDNEHICMAILEWVKELAENNLGWKYKNPVMQLFHWNDYRVTYTTNFMYNDIYNDSYPGMVAENIDFIIDKTINFSGPAECMWCGEEIDYDSVHEANTLNCAECQGYCQCSHCEEYYDRDSLYRTEDGQYLCEECYFEAYTQCEVCGDHLPTEEVHKIEIYFDPCAMKDYANTQLKKNNKFSQRANEGYYFIDNCSRDICNTCFITHTGKNIEECLIWEEKIPMRSNRNYYGDYFTVTEHINPTKITFEQANELFHFFPASYDTDGSYTAVYKHAWEHLTQTLIENEIITF